MLLLRLVLSRYQPLALLQTEYTAGRVWIHKLPEATLGRFNAVLRKVKLATMLSSASCFFT